MIARNGYEGIKPTGKLIANSGLDWTQEGIPNLKDGDADGGVYVGWYGKTKLSMKLSRGSLAKFLEDHVTDKAVLRLAPAIVVIRRPDLAVHALADTARPIPGKDCQLAQQMHCQTD